MHEEIAPHAKDISRALGGKISEKEIENELSNYLNVYRVSLDTAKRSIVKKHGGDPSNLALGVSKKIADLIPGEQSVDLLCRIVSVDGRQIDVEGGSKDILYGILGDQTATVPFTAWSTEGLDLQKGDIVQIRNAYTKEFRGQVQVNFGNRTSVAKESPDALPPYDPSKTPLPSTKPKPLKIVELREGTSNVSLTGRLLNVEKREVTVNGDAKTVYSGVLADDTGKVQYSAWKDFNLSKGEVIRIEGGYVKMWRGIPQFSFDERARVTILEDSDLPSIEDLGKPPRIWIEDLAERGGAIDTIVRGIVIDIKEGSGLVYRCPECKRVLRKMVCRIHGEVQGVADLRVKAVVDDGSGALIAVFGRDLTEQLLDKTLDKCIADAKESMNQEIVRDELADMLVAQPIEVRGNVTSDDYGLMMIVDSAKIMKVDVEQEARTMLEELEGLEDTT